MRPPTSRKRETKRRPESVAAHDECSRCAIDEEKKNGERVQTYHQQFDLVNQRGRCKELVDGRQYFPFQRGSASGVSSLRASGPNVRPLAGTGQQLPAVFRSEVPLLQLSLRARVALLLRCAPPHPQQSRSARVGIRNVGDQLTLKGFLRTLRASNED